MKKKLLVLASVMLSIFLSFTLVMPAIAATASPSVYESYTSGNTMEVFFGPHWKGQTFTPRVSHTITRVDISLFRAGNPTGDVIVSIRETDATGLPVGGDRASGRILASSISTSGSPSLYSFALGAGYPLVAGKTYAIIWRALGANGANPIYFSVNTAGAYSGGWVIDSQGGASWSDTRAWDAVFQEWGLAGTSSPTPSPTPTPTPTPTLTPTPSPSTYESYANWNAIDLFFGPYWKGQTFTPQTSHTITRANISLVKVGNPAGDVILSIRATDASGRPVGSDLASGKIPASSISSSWSLSSYSFDLGAGYPLVAGKTYAIIWRAPGADSTNPIYFSVNTGGTYAGGWVVGSADGVSWIDTVARAWDAVFQESGVTAGTSSPAPSPTPTPTPTPTPNPTPTPAPAPAPSPAYNKVGYVATGTMGYNPWGQVTHIIWQDIQVNSATDPGLRLDPELPYLSWSQLSSVVSTAHANNAKVLVCLGGPYNRYDLNSITSSPTLRAALVNNLRNLITTYNLDGMDIDWESGPDPNIYAQFVKELRVAMPDKIISVIGIWPSINIAPSAAADVDFVNVMSYDYWQGALYGSYEVVTQTMNMWAAAGFPKNKLVMGIPFRTYPWNSYAAILNTYNPAPSQNASTDGLYTWNGPDLVKAKANFVKANGFGGVFFYELSLDRYNDSRSLLLAAQ